MAKHMVGVYETPGETLLAIENLESKGYSAEDIFIVANRNDIDYLENRDGTNLIKPEHENTDNASGGSFWERTFSAEDDEGYERENIKFELSEVEISQYNEALTRGKIVILAERPYHDEKRVIKDEELARIPVRKEEQIAQRHEGEVF